MKEFSIVSFLLTFILIQVTLASNPSDSFQKIRRQNEAWKTLPATPDLPSGYTEHQLPINNGSIWYATWEGDEAQPPLVFFPGALSSSTWFGNQIKHLLGSRKIIAIDSRQQGRSTGSGALTYDIMAQDALDVLSALGITQRVDVIGWSDGGAIALNLLLNHASRLSRSFIFGANYEVSGVYSETAPLAAEAAARLKSIYESINPKPNWSNLVNTFSAMWATLPAWGQADFTKVSNTDGKKVWIVEGAHDEVVKASQADDLASWISGSHKLIFPDVSHYAFVQNPSEVNSALDDWLKIAN